MRDVSVPEFSPSVIPAKAGIHGIHIDLYCPDWVPAFAGMTEMEDLRSEHWTIGRALAGLLSADT